MNLASLKFTLLILMLKDKMFILGK